jgi:hypothetical protein
MWKCKVTRFSQPAPTRVVKWTKNCFGPRAKCPPWLTDFDQTCAPCGLSEDSSRCDVSDFSTHRKGKYVWKTPSASRVKDPSRQTEFDQTSTACGLCAGSTTCDGSVSPLDFDPKWDEKSSPSCVKFPWIQTDLCQTRTAGSLWCGSGRPHFCPSMAGGPALPPSLALPASLTSCFSCPACPSWTSSLPALLADLPGCACVALPVWIPLKEFSSKFKSQAL